MAQLIKVRPGKEVDPCGKFQILFKEEEILRNDNGLWSRKFQISGSSKLYTCILKQFYLNLKYLTN